MLQNQSISNYDIAGDNSGFSVFYATSSANSKPTGTDHAVTTLSYSDLWQVQEAADWRTNARYIRKQENGTWSSWQRLFADDYHPNADKWTTARTLSLTGDVTGSTSWDGSGNASITATIADDSHNHTIANVDGLQTALDGKVDDSQVLTNVPSGAVFTDTVYSHPTYTGDDFSVDTGALTGATVVSDIDINVTTDTLGHVTDANGVVSTRTLTLGDLGYTGATNANYFTYTHPTYAGDDLSVDTGALTGATVISDLDFNVTTDTLGHVTDANATIATRNLTAADIGAAAASHTHSYLPLTGGTISGDLTITGTLVESSDARLKENVRPITDALSKVTSLQGVHYNKIETPESEEIGFIAQEVEVVVPEIVTTDDTEEGMKAVSYARTVALLVEAIKEQQVIIDKQNERLSILETKL